MKTFNHDFLDLPVLKKVTNEDGSRHYVTPEGNHYMSVTTLTSKLSEDSIAAWRRSVGEEKANRISKAATTRGSLLHETVESYLRNNLNKTFLDMPLNKALFLKMRQRLDKIDNIRIIEGTLYSDDLKLAGTTDCIGDYSNELSVIDFKTASKAKMRKYIDGYFIQGGAYGRMYEEMTGIAPKNVVILIAAEDIPVAQVFTEPYPKCHKMLVDFMRTLPKT